MGRYDLGLSSEEFYELTPRQFDALLKRHLAFLKREHDELEFNEYMTAQLICLMANVNRGADTKPFKPTDFMPSRWMKKANKKTSKPKRKRITKKMQDELTAKFRLMFPVIKKK